MIENLFSAPMIILYALLYGMTMKIADLLDEHGLKFFKGDAVIFGILWGVFGALLVSGNVAIANIVLAMNVAFLIRGSLDYLNHRIAASIIILSFLFFSSINPGIFLIFLSLFVLFGVLEDRTDNIPKKKRGILFYFSELLFYYPALAFAYCIAYGNWMVFFVFLSFSLSYISAKYAFKIRQNR
jgi:hypothetical protein